MKFITLLIVSIWLTGCATNLPEYNPYTYVRKTHTRTYSPIDAKEYAFENTDIKLTYMPDIEGPGVNVQVANKSKESIKIIWDESVFVDETNKSNRIVHEGVTLKDTDKSQPPSIVVAGTTHSDKLIPADSPTLESTGWTYEPLCGFVDRNDKWQFKDEVCLGKTFQYHLTYELNGKKKTAKFAFKYLSKEPIQRNAASK
jgi:hypothetical protein